jgi:hypothetical protein
LNGSLVKESLAIPSSLARPDAWILPVEPIGLVQPAALTKAGLHR